jgi:2-dehydro-3-deoxyphosphogluconate aldolase/(4S)-4-hydroxy-2-oxoglutarate aldolase
MSGMKKEEVLKKIADVGIVPVVRAESATEAFAVANAIQAGGVPILEITMTVPGAIEVISALSARLGAEALIGAGTVIDADTAEKCIQAGAQFVVSPSLNLKVIELCQRYSISVCPGALTPTEVVSAWQAGTDVIKSFPAEPWEERNTSRRSRLPYLKSMMPTGGVTLETAVDFIAAGAVAQGVGADLVNLKALRNGEPEKITNSARAYAETVRRARQDSWVAA